jgi:hypothetical protein
MCFKQIEMGITVLTLANHIEENFQLRRVGGIKVLNQGKETDFWRTRGKFHMAKEGITMFAVELVQRVVGLEKEVLDLSERQEIRYLQGEPNLGRKLLEFGRVATLGKLELGHIRNANN